MASRFGMCQTRGVQRCGPLWCARVVREMSRSTKIFSSCRWRRLVADSIAGLAAFLTQSAPSVSAESESGTRSEEHTSELQSQFHLVCRLLLEKKKKNKK